MYLFRTLSRRKRINLVRYDVLINLTSIGLCQSHLKFGNSAENLLRYLNINYLCCFSEVFSSNIRK